MDNDQLLLVIKDMFEKKTDEIKDMFDRKTDEIKTYVDEKINGQGILLESLKRDVKAVAEGHSILDGKIESLQKDMTETKQEVFEVKREVSTVKQEILEIKQEIGGLKKDMTTVKDYVVGVDAKLNEHEIILKRVK